MSSLQHTPGPWELSGDLIVGAPEPRPNPKVEPYGHPVAKLCWDFDGDRCANGDLPWKIAEANGKLIKAAPDLLAVCAALVETVDRYDEGDIEAEQFLEYVRRRRDEANTAVAKAKCGTA